MTLNGRHDPAAQNGRLHPPPPADEGCFDRRPAFEQRLKAQWRRRFKRLVKRVVLTVFGVVGAVSRLRVRPRAPLRAGDPRIRRILVVRVDLIGDVVLSLPAVRALRRAYPDAEIDMLVLPSSAGVLAGQPDVTRVLTYDPNIWRRPLSLLSPRRWAAARALVASLRSGRYDLSVSVNGDWGSVLAWVSGARRRVGYAGEPYPGLMTDAVPGGRYGVRKHEVEYVRALARAAGGLVRDDDLPVLHVTPEAASAVALTLERRGIACGCHPLVVLHPGARNGLAKRWPSRHWAALADRLVRQVGAQVVLVGAAADAEISAPIMRQAHQRVHDFTGLTTLAELVALLARADVLVSGDSGPLHIACALGTPVVGLYGPTDPAISGPLAPDAIVLRREIWCGPCYNASETADCRFGNPVCMKGLSPEVAFAAVLRQVARRRPEIVLAPGPQPDDRPVEPATTDAHGAS
jgi:lipopolysaccharide heptosyltransferase II